MFLASSLCRLCLYILSVWSLCIASHLSMSHVSSGKPEGKNRDCGKERKHEPIEPLRLEFVEQIGFASKTARPHGEVHISTELKRFRHQYAGTCGRHSPKLRAFQLPDHPALPRFEHV